MVQVFETEKLSLNVALKFVNSTVFLLEVKTTRTKTRTKKKKVEQILCTFFVLKTIRSLQLNHMGRVSDSVKWKHYAGFDRKLL